MDPSQELDQSTPDTQPIPPRYWWLKRLTLAGVVTIAACIALRLWWGFEADRRLQALIDEYRAAGQPVLIEDFAEILSVPDDQNAALLLLEAAQKLVYPENTGLPYPSELLTLSAVAQHPEEVRKILELNAEVLRLAREARSRPRANWKKGFGSGQVFTFSAQRVICQLLTVSALHAYHVGNHAESLESVHDLLLQADAILRHPLLIDQFIGFAIEDLALNLIEEIGSRLHFGEFGVSPASREQAGQIIAYFLDFERRHEQSILAAFGERAVALDEVSKLRIAGPVGLDHLLLPATVLETELALRLRTLAIDAMQAGNARAAQQVLDSWQDRRPRFLQSAVRPLSGPMGPDWSHLEIERSAMHLYFKLEASRRMAAIALAMRLYETDHRSRPTSLDQLVPIYLPRLPDDPFGPAGTTFRRTHTLDSEVLYSVGPDGDDDGGAPLVSTTRRIDLYQRNGDIPFYLDGRPESRSPQPPASPQTGKDDIDSGEQGGDAEQNDAPGDRPK